MMGFSLNNRFIVEAYVTDRGLKTVVNNGFAQISQKVSLKGLRLLVDVKLIGYGTESFSLDGASKSGSIHIPAGSTIYVREELLHTQQWAQKTFECEGIDGKFMIVDIAHVEFVKSR